MTHNGNDRTCYIGIRIRGEIREKLEALAQREEVGLSVVVRWAIKQYLERRSSDGKN